MIAIKPGVRVEGLQPEILLALFIAHELFKEQAQTITLTCGTDGQHKASSRHYCGQAVDIRLPTAGKERLVEQLAGRLGEGYDVVLEGDHIHVEFDPKHG